MSGLLDVLDAWRIVGAAELGASDDAEVCFGRGWYAFWLPSAGPGGVSLAGTYVIGEVGPEEARLSLQAWLALQRHARAPFRVHCDLAIMMPRGADLVTLFAEFSANVGAVYAARSPLCERVATLVADDWLFNFWQGTIAAGAPETAGSRNFVAPEEAWAFLDATPLERERIDGLKRALCEQDQTARDAFHHLMMQPKARLEDIARATAMSVRSLQRALAERGDSFAAMRDRVRLVIAESRLAAGDKIAAVADEVGFASASHFVTWFKRHRGATPGLARLTRH